MTALLCQYAFVWLTIQCTWKVHIYPYIFISAQFVLKSIIFIFQFHFPISHILVPRIKLAQYISCLKRYMKQKENSTTGAWISIVTNCDVLDC